MREGFPEDWELTKVRDLLLHSASGPSPTCEEREITGSSEWGLFKTTAITWDGWNEHAHKVLPEQYWGLSSLEVREGDVCVTKAGPRHRVGVVSYVTQTRSRLIVSGKMILLRANPKVINPKVLALILSSGYCQAHFESRKSGMAESQVNFSNRDLLDLEIPVPPLTEQERISEIVDDVDSRGNSIRLELQKFLKLTQGVNSDLIDWRPGGSPKRGWRLTSLEQVAEGNPICYGIVQAGEHDPDGVPVVMIRDLLGNFKNLSRASHSIDSSYSRSRIQGGDVLLSIKATIGRTAVVPEGFTGNISRDLAKIRPTSSHSPDFIRWALSTSAMQRTLHGAVVGSTRAEISIATLKKIMIPLPEKHEQLKIMEVIRSHELHQISLSIELAKLRALKQSLVGDLITGRVRVPVSGEL